MAGDSGYPLRSHPAYGLKLKRFTNKIPLENHPMNLFKVIIPLIFGVSFKAHSGIKSWYERDDCRMLIHVGCGSDWNPKQLAGLSESFKRALEEGRAGFKNVILANIDTPVHSYDCRQLNETAPFGMFMSLRNIDGKICMGFATRDKQKKGLEKISLGPVNTYGAHLRSGRNG